METLPSFALDLQKDNMLMSGDVKGGYHRFTFNRTCGISSSFAETGFSMVVWDCLLGGEETVSGL